MQLAADPRGRLAQKRSHVHASPHRACLPSRPHACPRACAVNAVMGTARTLSVCYDQNIMIDSSWLMFPMFPALLSAVFFAAGIVTVYAADGAYPQIRS